MPSNEPIFSLMRPFSKKFAYLSMLFIVELGCTAYNSRINNMHKLASVDKNHASNVKTEPFEGKMFDMLGTMLQLFG